jgi:hypothetical protein
VLMCTWEGPGPVCHAYKLSCNALVARY